ncbi:hypothetical protein ACQ4PT_022848 [Festuca glaucescens]
MMSSSAERGKQKESSDPRGATRSRLEEAMAKLGLTEEEAVPLVLDDVEVGKKPKWMLAGKVLYRNQFHIQTIASALRPAWRNPRGLDFRSVGENTFVAEFESQRDRDRVRDGSPWHVSKNAMILEEFVECMQPSELKFDKLQLWVRVLNLPFNLRTPDWGKAIEKKIDKNSAQVVFDPVGGFLRARVTVDVTKPLRRGILIDSAARKGRDWYEFQYEHIPHFCFSCGRLGHSDLMCPTPGTRDEDGSLPYGASLRALDEGKRSGSNDNSSREHFAGQNSRWETKFSSNVPEAGGEATSPAKKSEGRKRKGNANVPKLMYRKVGEVQPPGSVVGDVNAKQIVAFTAQPAGGQGVTLPAEEVGENESNKKRKTPSSSINSAEAAAQPCQAQ